MDKTGKEHKIWYVADKDGFRAFGDILPTLPYSEISTQTSKFPFSLPFTESPDTMASELQLHFAITERIGSFRPPSTEENTPMSLFLKAANPPDVNQFSQIHSPSVSSLNINKLFGQKPPIDASENRQSIVERNQSTGKSFSGNSASFDFARNHSFVRTRRPETKENNQTSTLNRGGFTLVKKTRLPTERKQKTHPTPIEPKPLSERAEHEVVSGLHSSGVIPNSRSPNAEILGPSLSRLILEGPLAKRDYQRPVPRPSIVEGDVNLDNFFLPKRLAQSRSSTFESPEPTADYDYYGYDYYMYDPIDTPQPNSRVKSNPADPVGTLRSVSSTTPKSKRRKQNDDDEEDNSENDEENPSLEIS